MGEAGFRATNCSLGRPARRRLKLSQPWCVAGCLEPLLARLWCAAGFHEPFPAGRGAPQASSRQPMLCCIAGCISDDFYQLWLRPSEARERLRKTPEPRPSDSEGATEVAHAC